VDGHNSHYTIAFLLYAREHLIIVFCYIPHGTHIYQGLDVVIFSPLKKYIGEEWDNWLWEYGATMDKNTFLAIYGQAHVRAGEARCDKMMVIAWSATVYTAWLCALLPRHVIRPDVPITLFHPPPSC
jgi:hypothetical protein